MAQTTLAQNPFMMMIEPEVILAAVERSERLGQLNRHLCRPLDRPVIAPRKGGEAAPAVEAEEPDVDDDGSDEAEAL